MNDEKQGGLFDPTAKVSPSNPLSMKKPVVEEVKLRSVREIALEIILKWKKPYFGAVPYMRAMTALEDAKESYGQDPGHDIVSRFLCNAITWRGDDARRMKAELKQHLKNAGIKS
jgi:hypothetical protein